MKKMVSGKWLVASGFLAILVQIISCGEKSATVNYSLQSPVKMKVFAQSNYATMEGEFEQIGTVTATHFINEYKQNGNMISLERTFVGDASRGYLKKSYPPELALRMPKLNLYAKGISVENIEGYENFDSAVVAKITIPDRWKTQISRMTRPIDLERIEKRRWEITHLIEGKVPLKTNITRLLASQGRIPNIPNAQIDSVLTKGIKKIDNIKCLEYTVYLQEKEPFPYFIWEQHTSSVASGKPFKSYKPTEAWYQNRYDVAINLENGLPCQEMEIKRGIHGMKHPETGDSVVFRSQVSHERLYTLINED